MRLQAGQPVRPYAMHRANAGNTIRIDLTSLDFEGALEAPTALRYRIDNLTDQIVVTDWTAITPLSTEMTLTISAATNAMYRQWQDTQLNQVTFEATYADESIAQVTGCYELSAVYNLATV